MDTEPTSDDKATPDSLEGCNHLTILAWGATVAPIAIGLALGAAVVTGGEVLFGCPGRKIHPFEEQPFKVNNLSWPKTLIRWQLGNIMVSHATVGGSCDAICPLRGERRPVGSLMAKPPALAGAGFFAHYLSVRHPSLLAETLRR